MRDTGTSSGQTAGCGHTEIQQGLPVKQDYWLQRVSGDTQQGLLVTENYRFQRNLLFPPLLARRQLQ